MEPGDELMLWCAGGPSMLRRVLFPPPLEIVEDGGMYVLDDDADEPSNWRYVFLADGAA